MKRILAAVDGSEPSLRGAVLAAELAGQLGARLTLAYAVVPMVYPAETTWIPVNEVERAADAHAQEVLRKAAGHLRERGFEASTLIVHGAAAEALSEAAATGEFELVAIGSRGRGAVARVLLGSVADRLVHICSRPVLVVR